MFLLLLVAYVAVAVCVGVVLNRRPFIGEIPNWAFVISLAVCWPIHLWSWFSEFRKELF